MSLEHLSCLVSVPVSARRASSALFLSLTAFGHCSLWAGFPVAVNAQSGRVGGSHASFQNQLGSLNEKKIPGAARALFDDY